MDFYIIAGIGFLLFIAGFFIGYLQASNDVEKIYNQIIPMRGKNLGRRKDDKKGL